MKRTKRYGGFLVGDRVQRKDGVFNKLPNGIVTGMRYGLIYTKWTDLNGKDFGATFSPNQLTNLTRLEEEQKQKELSDKIDKKINELFSPEDGKELFKVLTQDDFMKDFKPTPFEDLTTGTLEEREEKLRKLAEQKLSEMYGVEQPIVDNPALEESKENITYVSEETANELNDAIQSLNNEPIIAQFGENGELYVEFEKELEERFKRMGMDNWKPEDHDIMPPKQENTEPTTEEMLKWICENYPYYENYVRVLLRNPLRCRILYQKLKEAKEYADIHLEAVKEFGDALDEILSPKHPYPYDKDFSSTADY